MSAPGRRLRGNPGIRTYIHNMEDVAFGREGVADMDKLRFEAVPRQQAPFMNKGVVLESYKAVCLLIDWVRAVLAERVDGGPISTGAALDKWSILEHISRTEVVSYGQIADTQHLLRIMAGLEFALLLSGEKDEAFEIRREWQKLGRWMNLHYNKETALSGPIFMNLLCDLGEVPRREAMAFMFEHMPELKSGWKEGGADALNDYLYVLWLEARGGQ